MLDRTEDSRVWVSENFQKNVMLVVKTEDRVIDDNQFCHYLEDTLLLGMMRGNLSQ